MVSGVFGVRGGFVAQPVANEPPMTDGLMNLRTLVKKAPDGDLMRAMIAFAAGLLMSVR